MDAAVEPVGPGLATAVAAHRGRIYRYLLSMTRDPDAAEDLTQETLLRALRAAGALREPAALLSWLYRLATNVFLDQVRAGRRRPLADREGRPGPGGGPADEIPDPGPRVDRLAEQAEMSACVQEYVSQLPPGYRAVILLHDEYGLTDREIAQCLGLSVATAKMRIHRGRARLRAALEAGCQFEADDRGVLVCDPAPGRCDCGTGCAEPSAHAHLPPAARPCR